MLSGTGHGKETTLMPDTGDTVESVEFVPAVIVANGFDPSEMACVSH
jgi:hypothetical protein